MLDLMKDMDGNVINDNYDTLSAFNYPNDADISFQTSVLESI